LPNKIGELCQNISKEIDSRVQDVLDGLSKDCGCLSKIVDEKVRYVEFRALGAATSGPLTITSICGPRESPSRPLFSRPCAKPKKHNRRIPGRAQQEVRDAQHLLVCLEGCHRHHGGAGCCCRRLLVDGEPRRDRSAQSMRLFCQQGADEDFARRVPDPGAHVTQILGHK